MNLRLRAAGEPHKARLESLVGDVRMAPVESLANLCGRISRPNIRALRQAGISTLGKLAQTPEDRLNKAFSSEEIGALREGLRAVGLTLDFAA